jgi:HEPN domain-containing protein
VSLFCGPPERRKGIKAVFLKANRNAWGHSVSALLQHLPPPWQADNSLLSAGKELDKQYIPSRYPHAFPQGAPCDYYTEEEGYRRFLQFLPVMPAEPNH